MARLVLSPLLFWSCAGGNALAEDGYDLWLRYRPIEPPSLREEYRKRITAIVVDGPSSDTLEVAREELVRGLTGLLGNEIPARDSVSGSGAVIVGTSRSSPTIQRLKLTQQLKDLGGEGFLIRSARVDGHDCTVIAANEEIGALYGVFHFLRLVQSGQDIRALDIAGAPRIQLRLLNHWDNLDGSVERGYAGKSLWNWEEWPEHIDPRMKDYARTNASVGINGTVLNNVNSNAIFLSSDYIQKTAAVADVFRPYGIRVYLSARFTAPLELDGLETADPLDPQVVAWWKSKADEIYRLIPDFGGFLMKANSEGQPGPADYGRTHAGGANMLARAVWPHGGVVLWRAFVYGYGLDPDRVKQAYQAFVPLDGRFDPNVLVQVKNGPLDFQPREPVHPLFGAMPHTPLLMEMQITQEYLGHSTFLVYLAPMWKEVLEFDTFASGPGSTVAKVIDGSLQRQELSGIAGVANTGNDRNWCDHHFAQANWYAFGRLAWDPDLDARAIAEEWTKMTFTRDQPVVDTIVGMMMNSWEGVVDTMTPLGLNVLCSFDHYAPGPQMRGSYHQADETGLGYDRTRGGSDAVDQYHPPNCDVFNNLDTCPEKYLLWFHHVAWDHKLNSGRTLWEELCVRYRRGAESARTLRETWESLRGKIDEQRFREVEERLKTQERDAAAWRDACISHFKTFSQRPLPE